MLLSAIGQRCVSEREPELGLGIVSQLDAGRIGISFPATGEQRLYARGTSVLKRVVFREGETVRARDGAVLTVERIDEDGELLVYAGEGKRIREDQLSDVSSVSTPLERFTTAQVDPASVFDLRLRALEAQAKFRSSDVRGLLGGRIDLIPHQLYIAHEVATRQQPRVMLADEVGLGKTIEACLILQRLLAVGRARRVLVLVPESLVHQWFVELLRRFNLWFSILDDDRCRAMVEAQPGANPFLETQLAICALPFLTHDEQRRAEAVEAGWDMVVVDEAHHLEWTPEYHSPEYALVAELAARSPGLLLLTATPTHHGLAAHFARLRLLDPHRYEDLERFRAETDRYRAVAGIIDRILGHAALTANDEKVLRRLFDRDPERLSQALEALKDGGDDARRALVRVLLDQHGTGRVIFRNTRAVIPGFPKREYRPATLQFRGTVAAEPSPEEEGDDDDVLAMDAPTPEAFRTRMARELEAEETGTDGALRYAFRHDPRLEWLVRFLRAHRTAKVLLICRSKRKVLALGAALQQRINAKVALFHEDLPLVQRDRQAAWFAEPEGAQLMICSEIGSEGRNFQFAHHLVLFDLPLNPAVVEQRIGRLDRIGQTQAIQIHVPVVEASPLELVADWYHRGVDAFSRPLPGGEEYAEQFRDRVLGLAKRAGGTTDAREQDALVKDTIAFRAERERELHEGRDRLLELSSFDRGEAERIVERIRKHDSEKSLRHLLVALLDHFGVRIREHEEGDVFLDPSHAYVEAFPSIPADGMLATFERRRAISREDITFVTPDHPLVGDAIDLLINSPRGTTAFGVVPARSRGLVLEAVFVLETVADARWHVDQFLPPTPLRVAVDVSGRELSGEEDPRPAPGDVNDADIHRFLEQPGFNADLLRQLAEGAREAADGRADDLRQKAAAEATRVLNQELQRLEALARVNDHIRPEEIALVGEQLNQVVEAIQNARLRLDSIRLLLLQPE